MRLTNSIIEEAAEDQGEYRRLLIKLLVANPITPVSYKSTILKPRLKKDSVLHPDLIDMSIPPCFYCDNLNFQECVEKHLDCKAFRRFCAMDERAGSNSNRVKWIGSPRTLKKYIGENKKSILRNDQEETALGGRGKRGGRL